MSDSPRNPKESLFSHGGYAITFGYGLIIGFATLVAFLIKPWSAGCFSLSEINAFFDVPVQLEEAQSMAFCVLSFSELFHMLGMTDVKHSFIRVFKDKNWLLWISFFVGMGLIIGVAILQTAIAYLFFLHSLKRYSSAGA